MNNIIISHTTIMSSIRKSQNYYVFITELSLLYDVYVHQSYSLIQFLKDLYYLGFLSFSLIGADHI